MDDKGDKNLLSIEITHPPILKYVPPIRELFKEILQAFGYEEKESFHAEVVVDELDTNAIIYGSNKMSAYINIKMEFNERLYMINIEDKGNNKIHKERLLTIIDRLNKKVDKVKNEGKGLFLVKLISDEIEVKINEFGDTTIHVVKYKDKNNKKES